MLLLSFFFFNDTATTEIYTLSLHDALPICAGERRGALAGEDVDHRLVEVALGQCGAPFVDLEDVAVVRAVRPLMVHQAPAGDRKSTRLNSSHANISYAVFCLKKKQNPTSND